MRVLQVVTLVSEDGAYGGPTTVARNQCEELAGRGNSVVLAGTYQNRCLKPALSSGPVSVKLFKARRVLPRTGFAGLASAGLLLWLVKNIRSFDVVHVHLARDLVTLPAALLAIAFRKPLFVQTHGMIDRSSKPLSKPLDSVATKPVLRSAEKVFFLTTRERRDLLEVGTPELSLVELRNGIPAAPPMSLKVPQNQGSTDLPEVLFLARLHKRKRPKIFAQAASDISARGVEAKFTLIGPDEGEAVGVGEITEGLSNISWEGSVSPHDVAMRLSRADIYVLPSVDEPYPMTVLEAMSVGLPVIVTDSCGLADVIRSAECGLVVGDDLGALDDAISYLIANPCEGRLMGSRGKCRVEAELGMSSVGDLLIEEYSQSIR